MESITKGNLIHHLSVESLLSPFQHGFLLKRSTLSASLSTFFDWLNSFKNHCHTHCVLVDLSKAFNYISHTKFLQNSHFTLFIPYVLIR